MVRATVVIPCHNSAWCLPTLAANLRAVLPADVEVVFVDDGSVDGSLELFQTLMPEARCFRQEKQGVGTARNRGVAEARGAFIQLLDADDTLCPGKFDAQIAFAEQHRCDVVYSDWRMLVFRGDARSEGPLVRSGDQEDVIAALLGGWWFATASALIRKQAYVGAGGCDPALYNTCDDLHLWLQMAIHGAAYGYCPGYFSNYHRYEDRVSISRQNRVDFIRGEIQILENALAALARTGQLSAARRQAAARRLHLAARNAYPLDRGWYEAVFRRVREVDPAFTPAGSPLYRVAWQVLGPARAESLALAVRRLRKRPAASDG